MDDDRAHPLKRVGWQAEGGDEPIEVVDRSTGQLDANLALELVENEEFAQRGLASPELRTVPRAVDAIEHDDDRVRGVFGVIDRRRQQATCEHALVDGYPGRQPIGREAWRDQRTAQHMYLASERGAVRQQHQ